MNEVLKVWLYALVSALLINGVALGFSVFKLADPMMWQAAGMLASAASVAALVPTIKRFKFLMDYVSNTTYFQVLGVSAYLWIIFPLQWWEWIQ